MIDDVSLKKGENKTMKYMELVRCACEAKLAGLKTFIYKGRTFTVKSVLQVT